MERALIWFKCAALHDPVRPVMKKPALIGWEAKKRDVQLVIERPFRGDELLLRMKGWFTADVENAIAIFKQYGSLRVLNDYDLVIEAKNMAELDALSRKLQEAFGEEVWVEHIAKERLE
ncbi:MAG: hypothetical protein K0B01_10610 [Syntrophobacterales bacterium]|nr:hypothetical protein [Syntrophobacterales bacterium]